MAIRHRTLDEIPLKSSNLSNSHRDLSNQKLLMKHLPVHPCFPLLLLALLFPAACRDDSSPQNDQQQRSSRNAKLTVKEFSSHEADWNNVKEAMKKGRPKTAIAALDQIITKTKNEGNWAEAVKALAQKITLEGEIEGNRVEEKITRLQTEIPQWPEGSRPILETILAHWYWQYFQQNRWRFMERTQTAVPPGEDILTWDLARIFAEIDNHFTAALADEETLRSEAIENYDDLLEKGTVPDSYRPTLYDFLAFEALSFYTSGEQAGAKAQDAFSFSAESPALGTVDEFLAWDPETTDTESPTLKAVQLWQKLLAFHQNDDRSDALIDADLARLSFAYNTAYGSDKETRYAAALEAFAEKWAANSISARARADWANVIRADGDLVKARQIALAGAEAHPDTPGGNECHNIVEGIEAPQSSLTVERVWNAPWPQIKFQYKNLNQAWFRVYEYQWDSLLSDDNWQVESLNEKLARALLKKKPVAAWETELPATDDFQERVEEIALPQDLPAGFYFVIASHDENFTKEKDNLTLLAPAWVSQLALITRVENGDGAIGGFVLDAVTGEPVEGAKVTPYRRERNNRVAALKPVTTDKDGLFSIPPTGQRHQNLILLAEHQGQRVATSNLIGNHLHNVRSRDTRQTYFFTDRSLYRPGQTIRYKGLATRVNPDKDTYEVEADLNVEVVFYDVNGQVISRQKQRSNDYGSFHGSFTAPRDRLMGRMRIQAEGESRGIAFINVEEYKRPKFKVTLDAPEEAARLEDEVKVKGSAMTYSGAAVDGAKVAYRVVREVRYPIWWRWCFWWLPPRDDGSQEIAHGEAATAADGTFEVAFTALPDRTVLPEDEPAFQYTIYADVTDPTGETRSDSRVINVGYTALRATVSADDWQEKGQAVTLRLVTESLDGEGQKAGGTVKIHRLEEPETVQRANLEGYRPYYPQWIWEGGKRVRPTPEPDPSNPNSWELSNVLESKDFETEENGKAELSFNLEPGIYRAMLETKDRFGKEVTARLPLQVLDPTAEKLALKIPNLVAAKQWSVEPGADFSGLWGTGYDSGRAYIEVESRGEILSAGWTDPGKTQAIITSPVVEKMRGGFTLRVTQVRENRAYLTQRTVAVPWTNKELDIKWSRHTSKLKPGQKETWTATITGSGAEQAVAEIAATLYDESLDAFLPHQWMNAFNVFRSEHSRMHSQFQNQINNFGSLLGHWSRHGKPVELRYRAFPGEIIHPPGMGMHFPGGFGFESARMRTKSAVPMVAAEPMAEMPLDGAADLAVAAAPPAAANGGKEEPAVPKPNLDQVSARKNLQETAFFFPDLISNDDGSVELKFTMPEALTSWKFFAFAHDADLRSGFLEDSIVTQKDIMVQPNPPRFLREGDELEFTVKVINLSDAVQQGTVRLGLSEARTGDSADEKLGNANRDKDFDIPAKESRTFSWRLDVPDGQGFLIYKAVASTGKLSDGEEGFLPVLPRRILVTESLPLPIRDAETKEFSFTKLIDSANSDSLQHESLSVQMVSNPSWYAVMALPYLMEYPHQCSEQIFNRLYANSLARHIAKSDPKIERVFEQWRGTDALDSPLEKNEDIKSVMLEETPWLRQGQKESEARRNAGILFDENRLTRELQNAQRQIAERQLPDGSWSWFPGGRGNDYITLYITTGYARLRHLGVKEIDMQPAFRSLARLDGWIKKHYDHLVKHKLLDKENLSSTVALYLYCRSFFLHDQPIGKPSQKAVDYFLKQASEHWLNLSRQSQGHVALALKRFDQFPGTPKDIVISLRERSKNEEEMGMYWRDTELSYWWYRAPIETQATMIEVFEEVDQDPSAVEDLKVWLLKQKQTRDWKTTKATADAVYALLLRGTDLLASDALVEVKIGDREIKPEKVEAGTGFFEEKLTRAEVNPGFGRITVKKTDPGVAWGGVHWQYFESMENITPHEGTPLKLQKKLYLKENTKKGPVLSEVKEGGKLKPGDELVVRLELRTDRDMEYIHLKDQRGSGTEPVNVLSQYQYQDGLGYYESTRDTASHFFIDYLPKGVYVFEYSTRVQHRGEYQSGMANIQCMYAPEFNSHSESFVLNVE